MKRMRLALSVLFVGLLNVATPLQAQERLEATYATAATAVPDPAQQLRETARLLRYNDLPGLVQALVPPAKYQLLRAAYEVKRTSPVSDSERAEFAEGLAKLTATDAIDRLMAEIEPKLVEARPKAAGAVMMGLGALNMALASDEAKLSDAEREALQRALPGIQRWATTTDFLSSLSMRQALTVLADAARSTGIDSIDELQALPFEQVLGKAGTMLAASKQALRIYGLDLDAIADSMQVQVLAQDGQTARVRTTFTVFDAPIAREHELVLVDGRWYGKDAVAHWSVHDDAEDDSES